jgi:kumamolisin
MTDDLPRRVPLAGSARPPLMSARSSSPPAPDIRVEFTVVLRRRAPLPAPVIAAGRSSRADLAARYGADPADVELTTRTLRAHGVEILAVDEASRRIRAAAPVRVIEAAFGARLLVSQITTPSGRVIEQRTRQGELSIPAELDGIVVAVLGLDNRPQARSRARIVAGAQVATSYTPPQLATVYDLPAADGTGQTIAILELGGGFAASDLDTYFSGLGLATPSVTAVGVDGASNQPGQDPSGADAEVLLDIEVAGGIAPKADVVVYFAPNTDAGFVDAISTAAHAEPTPTALSISWGQSEDEWTSQARDAVDAALADAAVLGVTVTAAAGDDGSTDRATDQVVHADFPASSPHILGCGGTTLYADPATGQVSSETVWNNGAGQGATGGGVSDVFPTPQWQADAGVPGRVDGGQGRGVPDVAAVADPRTGYQVYVDGQDQVVGGTSGVAPLWAGFTCRLAQALGTRLGLLGPRLYTPATPGHTSPGFRDITIGNNGAYQAAPGWDACTGLGVPDGTALLATLRGSPA